MLRKAWILSKLQSTIRPLGHHRVIAFLPKRSTMDHLQRVLQEHWNGGRTTVLMSLDIEKAFDCVSLNYEICLLIVLCVYSANFICFRQDCTCAVHKPHSRVLEGGAAADTMERTIISTL